MQITVQQAHQQLAESGHVFAELFQRKSVSVEIYRPEGKDLQQGQ